MEEVNGVLEALKTNTRAWIWYHWWWKMLPLPKRSSSPSRHWMTMSSHAHWNSDMGLMDDYLSWSRKANSGGVRFLNEDQACPAEWRIQHQPPYPKANAVLISVRPSVIIDIQPNMDFYLGHFRCDILSAASMDSKLSSSSLDCLKKGTSKREWISSSL